MSNPRVAARSCLALAAALAAAPAPRIHADTDSRATLVVSGDLLELELDVDVDRILEAVEAPPPAGDDWSEADVEAVAGRASEYLLSRWRLRLDGETPRWSATGFRLIRAFDPLRQRERVLRAAFEFAAPAPRRDAAASLVTSLFDFMEPAHRHTLFVAGTGIEPIEMAVRPGVPVDFTLLDVAPGAAARRIAARAAGGARAAAVQPWLALFLLALLAAPGSIDERARAAAAAAVAALAAFASARAGLLAPAAWASLAAAAISVGYVAAENRFARELKMRAATAALFGVVHGMALSSLAPRDAVGLLATGAHAGAALLAASLAAVALAGAAAAGRRVAPRAAPLALDLLLMTTGVAGALQAILAELPAA